MSLQIAVSPPIQKARLMLVSINFESSQLALTCIPFYCGVNKLKPLRNLRNLYETFNPSVAALQNDFKNRCK